MLSNKACFTTLLSNANEQNKLQHYHRLSQTCQSIGLNFDYTAEQFSQMISGYLDTHKFSQTVVLKIIYENREFKIEVREKLIANDELKKLKLKIINKPQKWNNLKLYPNDQQLALLAFAKEHNYDDVLILENNYIFETAIANIMLIKEQQIYTPKLNKHILKGTIRTKIIQMYDVIEKDITLEELLAADVVLYLNAVHIISVINQIENHKYELNEKTITKVLKMKKEIGASNE